MPQREQAFGPGQLAAQQRWGTPELWTEARIAQLIWDHVPGRYHGRIEAAPFFFLATSDAQGRCDCSFKGGGPGLVTVSTPKRLCFPHFGARVPGNGTYVSLGNILASPFVSLLFVDFADGGRLRVNGRASVQERGEASAAFPQAECLVVVDVERVVPSCPSYVPRLHPATAPATAALPR